MVGREDRTIVTGRLIGNPMLVATGRVYGDLILCQKGDLKAAKTNKQYQLGMDI
jgi:hypothetical protein